MRCTAKVKSRLYNCSNEVSLGKIRQIIELLFVLFHSELLLEVNNRLRKGHVWIIENRRAKNPKRTLTAAAFLSFLDMKQEFTQPVQENLQWCKDFIFYLSKYSVLHYLILFFFFFLASTVFFVAISLLWTQRIKYSLVCGSNLYTFKNLYFFSMFSSW